MKLYYRPALFLFFCYPWLANAEEVKLDLEERISLSQDEITRKFFSTPHVRRDATVLFKVPMNRQQLSHWIEANNVSALDITGTMKYGDQYTQSVWVLGVWRREFLARTRRDDAA